MHDDLQMMRQLEMEKCFLDRQIPCRWVPDMGFEYGFPLFNYYPPLPYLVGELVRLVGFSFVDTAKALFIFAFFASGITMYYLGKKFFGRSGGILAAIFYIWAPYHAVDIYVRGAMNEAWAMVWFPLLFLITYELIFSKKKSLNLKLIIALALSWCSLLLSHNLMVMIFTPVLGIWCLLWLLKSKAIKKVVDLLLGALWGTAMAAFFTLPVFVEKDLVHTDTLVKGYYEYTAHFVSIDQMLFSRFWGYGPSAWGVINDQMPFQVGHMHWIGALILFGLGAIYLIKNRNIPGWLWTVFGSLVIGWLAIFMAHSRSTPLWQAIPPLMYLQFPWRFLTLAIFGFSLAIGAYAMIFPKKVARVVMILAVVVLFFINKDYFLPQNGRLGALTDEQKFSGAAWDLQTTAGIYDYLPKSAKENPKNGPSAISEIISGEAVITNPQSGTNWLRFDIDSASQDARIRINRYEYPNWKVFIDNSQVEQVVPADEPWGRMYIKVPYGSHEVYAKLYNTQIRIISNIISVSAWILLGLILLKSRLKLRW